ncbi:iron-containing alcohol dehydrogenase [Alcanivorax quisquiliarum]|uniref:Iron-containing alcohol dehydrogenase n=1 Tax=Alcanivorax quisquiliarum TaxID=2933565 RepID=A0ABT0E4C0_9GAMM|nr:iron-containing alcohol dehydrogenase [Alcanivorax quisquiliarum]MCK0536664.1 iron-containing alcohol dehydrogenase [Alcanivorax quisquiliarum]
MTPFSFNTTPRILCEPGASEKLAALAAGLGVQRPCLISDGGIAASGLLEPVQAQLEQAGLQVTVFSDVIADPPEAIIHKALQQAVQARCDGVIGFGGGSAMDTAKLIALLLDGSQSLQEIYGVDQARGKRMPLIQVPTTAGTGSEVTPIAIVTTGETTKQGVVAPQLLPDIAVLDARLTLGLPPAVTAATGIDAMVHAIEAYTSRHRKNPYSDMLAREALGLLARNIEAAVHTGDDETARSNMLLGALLAGQAFANAPVAAVHALAYPLGGIYHIPHGLSNSLVLPHVLRFNLDAARTEYTALAAIILPPQEALGDDAAEKMIDFLADLATRLNLPTRLRDLDIPESALPRLAAEAMLQQRLLVNNPRDVSEQDALAIYQAAW